MPRLPPDCIGCILPHLPTTQWRQSRLVNRAWNAQSKLSCTNRHFVIPDAICLHPHMSWIQSLHINLHDGKHAHQIPLLHVLHNWKLRHLHITCYNVILDSCPWLLTLPHLHSLSINGIVSRELSHTISLCPIISLIINYHSIDSYVQRQIAKSTSITSLTYPSDHCIVDLSPMPQLRILKCLTFKDKLPSSLHLLTIKYLSGPYTFIDPLISYIQSSQIREIHITNGLTLTTRECSRLESFSRVKRCKGISIHHSSVIIYHIYCHF